MKYISRTLVGAIVGAIMGLIFGAYFGLVYAPHHWVTITWVIDISLMGTVGGAFGGVVTGTIGWVLHRRTAAEILCDKIGKAVSWKMIEVFFGAVQGMVFGGIIGAIVEAIIQIRKLSSFPDGKFFFLSDFTLLIIVVMLISAIVGAIHGFRNEVPKRAIIGLMRGLCSGVIIGAAVGVIWSVFNIGTLMFKSVGEIIDYSGITIGLIGSVASFGGCVGVISEVLGHSKK